MIGVEIKERLGNQLFRYAYARKLMIDRGNTDNLVLGVSSFKGLDPEDGWRNGLVDFRTIQFETSEKKLVYSRGTILQKWLLRSYYADIKLIRRPSDLTRKFAIQNKWNLLLQKYGLTVSYDNSFEPVFPADKDIYLEGSFENPKYFDSIRTTLIEELTPKQSPKPENRAIYDAAEQSDSICVSVRRGDFLSPKFRHTHNVCTLEYYHKAIEEMKSRLENPVIIYFSDDIDWVKTNLATESDLCESGNDPTWEKLRMMYSCKHFILSNSTFAWWAQYLCRNKDKIVIAPEKWFNDNRPQNLLLDSFIKIHV